MHTLPPQRPQDYSQQVRHVDDVEALLHSLEGSGAELGSAPAQATTGDDAGDSEALNEVNALLGPLLGEAAGTGPVPAPPAPPVASAAAPAAASLAIPAKERSHGNTATPAFAGGGAERAAVSVAAQPARDPLVDDAEFLALLSGDGAAHQPAAGGQRGPAAPEPTTPPHEQRGTRAQNGSSRGTEQQGLSRCGDAAPRTGNTGGEAAEEDLVSQALSGLLEGNDAPLDASGFEFEDGF